ncbi:SRPBCC family protein [Nocardia iowensis]|uniref:SRPBCC family protein n=1 Tax=Nocardia iowensis TaxID=204891 RepID=A0ABX8RWR8_NOCIO|nr:SRPBCC family protein [Nocardia iowensis]QXN94104.1 SRPBCC family protein [Nocardia iowensis]
MTGVDAEIGTVFAHAASGGLVTENAVVINAPLDRVWADTNDVSAWPGLFSEYAAVEILDERPDYVRFRLTMHPDANGAVWSWVSERRLDPEGRVVHARRVETGPFEFMYLRWEYTPEAEGVRMRWQQRFRLKPTAPVTDEQMAERINTNTPREMSRIKQILEARHAADGAG